jgi:MFS family permease
MRNLMAITFIISLAMGITGLALPLYANDLGASYTEVGLLGTTYVALNFLFSPLAGHFSDRRGRKSLLVLGLFLVSISFALYLAINAVWWLLAVRLLQGAAEAPIWVNAQAAAGDLSTAKTRGKAMGTYGVSWAAGFSVGPLLGGYMYKTVGATPTFILGAVIAFAAMFIALATVLPKPQIIPQHIKIRELLPPCLLGFVYVGVLSIVFTIFSVYAYRLGVSATEVGLLITIFAAFRMLLFIPMGKFSDRHGPKSAIQWGLVFIVIGSIGLAVVQTYLLFVLMMIILAAAEGAIYPSVMSIVSKFGGQTSAYVIGIYNAVSVLGWAVLPPIGGYLVDRVSPFAPYLMCAGIALAALLAHRKLFPKK